MKNGYWDSPRRVYLLLTTGTAVGQSVTFGTYVLFLQNGIGLTPLEINLVNLAFFSSRFLLEVPTGAIADVFGRKTSYLVACALYAIGLFMYWCATSMLGSIAAEVVLAIGATCASGAFEAWAVDELRARDELDQMDDMLARGTTYGQLGMLVAAPVGSVAAAYFGLATPWLIGSVVNVLIGVAAYFLMRESRVRRTDRKAHHALADTVRGSVRYAVAPGAIRLFLILGALWTFAVQAPNMQWAPLFSESVGVAGTGFIASGFALLLALGGRLSPRFGRQLGQQRALALALGVVGIGIMLTPLLPFAWSLVPFFILQFFRGMYAPLKMANLNRAIDSDDRATVLSCEAMATYCGGMCGLLITGIIAQYVSMPAAWVVGGTACLLGAYLIRRNRALSR